MSKISFLDCPHNNVQEYSECCLDCGYNIYTTNTEYLNSLNKELLRKGLDETTRAIRDAEKKLGITKDE
jgi:hypothetical protein